MRVWTGEDLTVQAYGNLAEAIIVQACQDYEMALREDNRKLRREVEQFFKSKWFRMLTDLDPVDLINRLHKKVNSE